ncbi:unnamed protein product [Ceutorhynchus assimilis]|uniref:Methyltransferase domain-containing protein n=1 Tax=Ceutorhynchus assimilis TaxID=467358 RepID=A0A9N9MD26_9CUCU|nr:unnamed protein product [Ceutorhynchus assimilis]
MNNSLFISAYCKQEQYFVDIKTFIIINIYQLAGPCPLQLKLKILKKEPINKTNYISLSLAEINFEIITTTNSELTSLSKWPIILINNNYVVSGLCSVARQICKLSKNSNVQQLLGFREACLVACAESSIWTKFCEIDIPNTIEKLISNDFVSNNSFTLPHDVLKYENHLSQPVRIHNIFKIARDTQNDQSIKSSTARKELRVLHDYAEGPYITLSDVILFACFEIIFKYCQNISIESKIPLTMEWFNRQNSKIISFSLPIPLPKLENIIIVPEINNVSLYNADPTRIVSTKHTKQYKIESALDLLKTSNIKNNNLPFRYDIEFNWNCIPLEANPQGGALPAKRANRKCEQLENLIKATIAVVGNKTYKIVDFCSGSGHLGILIALVLPKCEIILVENKERSLARARETITKLNLNNIIIVQSNLDYFVGTFDLGLALHACGVATDLVLQMCIKNKADFVCCPCCYGGIKQCHEVSYPRSENFKNVFDKAEEQYFNLAHAADQTHDPENLKTKQGYFCMDVIDTDRQLYAQPYGYEVHLGKLQPVTCTNKNNLLVGVYNKID